MQISENTYLWIRLPWWSMEELEGIWADTPKNTLLALPVSTRYIKSVNKYYQWFVFLITFKMVYYKPYLENFSSEKIFTTPILFSLPHPNFPSNRVVLFLNRLHGLMGCMNGFVLRWEWKTWVLNQSVDLWETRMENLMYFKQI